METIKIIRKVLAVIILAGLLSCNNRMEDTKDVGDTTMTTLPPASQDTITNNDTLTVPAMPDTPPMKPGLPPTLKQ